MNSNNFNPKSIGSGKRNKNKIKKNIVRKVVSKFVNSSSTILDTIGSVLPSIVLETPLKPIGEYNNEREKKKLSSRKSSYSKLAMNNRKRAKELKEAKIEATYKNMARKLTSKSKSKPIRLEPIRRNLVQFSENKGNNLKSLPYSSKSSSSLSSLSSHSSKSSSSHNSNKNLLSSISLMENLNKIGRSKISIPRKKLKETQAKNRYYNPKSNSSSFNNEY